MGGLKVSRHVTLPLYKGLFTSTQFCKTICIYAGSQTLQLSSTQNPPTS